MLYEVNDCLNGMEQLSGCSSSFLRCFWLAWSWSPANLSTIDSREATVCYRKTATKRRLHGVSKYIGAMLTDVICWQVTAVDGATGALDDGRCSFEVKIAAYDRIG